LEIEVRRGDGRGSASDERAGSRERELKRMYADLALENAAIKDVLGRKL
jgi:hypothetical protein